MLMYKKYSKKQTMTQPSLLERVPQIHTSPEDLEEIPQPIIEALGQIAVDGQLLDDRDYIQHGLE